MTKKQAKQIVELLATIDVEVSAQDIAEIEDIDSLQEYLSDNEYFTVEIVYYSAAMDYLKENDPSLRESLDIAAEYDYPYSELSSEVLASIHATRKMEENWTEIRDEVESIINE